MFSFFSRRKALNARLAAYAATPTPTVYTDGQGNLVNAAKGATYSWSGVPAKWTR